MLEWICFFCTVRTIGSGLLQARILFEESYVTQNIDQNCRLLCISRLLTNDDSDSFCKEKIRTCKKKKTCWISSRIEKSNVVLATAENDSVKTPEDKTKILLEGYDYYVKLLFSDDLRKFFFLISPIILASLRVFCAFYRRCC